MSQISFTVDSEFDRQTHLSLITSPRNRTILPFSKPTAMKLRFSWTVKHVTYKNQHS